MSVRFVDIPGYLAKALTGASKVFSKGGPIARVSSEPTVDDEGNNLYPLESGNGSPIGFVDTAYGQPTSLSGTEKAPSGSAIAKSWNDQLEKVPLAISNEEYPLLVNSDVEVLGKNRGGNAIHVNKGNSPVLKQLPTASIIPDVARTLPGAYSMLIDEGFDPDRAAQFISNSMYGKDFLAFLVNSTGRVSGFSNQDINDALVSLFKYNKAANPGWTEEVHAGLTRPVSMGVLRAVKGILNDEGLNMKRATGSIGSTRYVNGKPVYVYSDTAKDFFDRGNPVKSVVLYDDDGSTTLNANTVTTGGPYAPLVHNLAELAKPDSLYYIPPGSPNHLILNYLLDLRDGILDLTDIAEHLTVNDANEYRDRLQKFSDNVKEQAAALREVPGLDIYGFGRSGFVDSNFKSPGTALADFSVKQIVPTVRALASFRTLQNLTQRALQAAKNANK